ncbi:hypothetical protein HUJ05_009793 [Dendroctonus ponderosae]|nr:hypothetical protein HUJ05_009793 [Dendroctonus ponderosae]
MTKHGDFSVGLNKYFKGKDCKFPFNLWLIFQILHIPPFKHSCVWTLPQIPKQEVKMEHSKAYFEPTGRHDHQPTNTQTHTHLVSVYAPDTGKPKSEIDKLYQSIKAVLDNIPRLDDMIILGDLNARIGNNVVSGVKNRFIKENLTVLPSANAGTNHNLVVAKITANVQYTKKQTSVKVSQRNIESPTVPLTKVLYQQRLNKKIESNHIVEIDNSKDAWQKIKSNLLKAAKEAVGRKTLNKSTKPNRKPSKEAKEVKELANETRKAYLKYRSQTLTLDECKAVRNTTNNKIQYIKRAHWESTFGRHGTGH